jgi:hypothetical protein
MFSFRKDQMEILPFLGFTVPTENRWPEKQEFRTLICGTVFISRNW